MNTNPQQLSDQMIDRVLTALRDTEAPRGLEARVAARLAQAAEARTDRTSAFVTAATRTGTKPLFAVIRTLSLSKGKDPRILLAQAPLYALATAILLAITITALQLHHQSTTIAHSIPLPASIDAPVVSDSRSGAPDLRAEGPLHHSVGRSPTYEQTTSEGPKARPITPASTINPAPAADDPDTIALAETRAPSRPAPPMPLTPQEQLLIAATRHGQPIELAELDLLRSPALRSAAEARDRSTIRQFAQGLLGPLAAAESLNADPPPNP